MSKNRTIRFFRKLHRWPAIIIGFIAIIFAVSGIFMNHRQLFSSVDISRKWLPANYTYKNWNLAAIRGSAEIDSTTSLMYGNVGIWKTNTDFQSFTDFNQGFPKGIDNRKIYSVIQHKNILYAGTQLGLYKRQNGGIWEKIKLNVAEDRIADLALKQDTLLVLTRHFLLKSPDGITFETVQLPEPEGYIRQTGLFNTFWELHSGELFGLTGKLIVDLLGLVTVLLAVTGLLHFFFPKIIRRRKNKNKSTGTIISAKKLNLRWHNVVGYIFALFLLINTFSGMHLRPPLLIAIASKQVDIIPGTHLDSPNPWFDKLRRVQWNGHFNKYIFSTSEGFYFTGENLKDKLQPFFYQPPVSIMGCNVLKPVSNTIYLVGSFSGMFLWNVENGAVADYFTKQPYVEPEGMQSPIAANMVAGLVEEKERTFWFDFNRGAILAEPFGANPAFTEMSGEIRKDSPISLWNASLEVHTGRVFENILGPFYILYVPLSGICILLVLISGVYLWWKVFRKTK